MYLLLPEKLGKLTGIIAANVWGGEWGTLSVSAMRMSANGMFWSKLSTQPP